ncbi:MetQ/NlpA family ABC transporter substrate-binding protein [Glaciihabitans sp. dw_435]|uniref:MetQ/NlpA family ABC transporter substrate-binding protein n=1 Tax=Glaciihabitans sp. dw_435 TaxID=2720081 RepID=UPI001BD57BD1|nr:MetQ/NlpA family ABC transporter substrate-binding protein [Glaciihabitans sp. dw_435]
MRFTPRSARLAGAAVAAILALGLSACSSTTSSDSGSASLGTIKVGALATPAGDILKFVQDNLAKDAGLDIQVTDFTDYNTPNLALSDGSIDANLFQNSTFLKTYNEASNDTLVSAGEIYLPSAAFYSTKVKSLDDLKDGAKIAIPNDPTNEGRALKILAAQDLITTTENPTTLKDITANTHNFDFVEIENATLAQSLPDVDAAFVTISFALPAGLTAKDSILIEDKDAPYYNVLATTAKLESDPRIVELKKLLLDPKTKAFIEKTWGGLVIPVS